MIKDTLRYFDFGYFLRFVIIFLLLFLGYTFVIAASAPTGTYYPFVDKYLNFPIVIRYCVLHIGQFILALLGYATTVVNDKIISYEGSSILQMAWACYGLGLKSFWIAFVCAHKMPWKQKLYWSVSGVGAIFFLNCIRVVVMMISMVDKWTIAEYLGTNAHDLFNYLCYIALMGLILAFYAKAKPQQKSPPIAALKA
jgi:exosortase/archaeosortase family protein